MFSTVSVATYLPGTLTSVTGHRHHLTFRSSAHTPHLAENTESASQPTCACAERVRVSQTRAHTYSSFTLYSPSNTPAGNVVSAFSHSVLTRMQTIGGLSCLPHLFYLPRVSTGIPASSDCITSIGRFSNTLQYTRRVVEAAKPAALYIVMHQKRTHKTLKPQTHSCFRLPSPSNTPAGRVVSAFSRRTLARFDRSERY